MRGFYANDAVSRKRTRVLRATSYGPATRDGLRGFPPVMINLELLNCVILEAVGKDWFFPVKYSFADCKVWLAAQT